MPYDSKDRTGISCEDAGASPDVSAGLTIKMGQVSLRKVVA